METQHASPPPQTRVGVSLRQLKAFNFVEATATSVTLSDGGRYVGDLKKVDFQGTGPPIPHGVGYCLLPDGVSRYGGDWKDGKYHGRGVLMTEELTYEGDWEHGAMHGNGTMGYKDTILKMVVRGIQLVSPFETRHRPAEYRGQFHHTHHRHGHGVMVYQSGDCYEGDWCKNMRDGFGTMKFADGEKYVGHWVNDERCGEGTMSHRDGSVYTGGMVKDKRHGEGILRLSNGDEYRGSFEEDTLTGSGTMVYKNGDTYSGGWRDGYRHGGGTFTLKRSGARIQGTFFKGLAHGPNCTATLPGRYTFRGQYKKGERTKGTVWICDGTVYMGEWAGDLMQGLGLMWHSTGDFYYGQFAKGKRNGKGSLTLADTGVEYAGTFVDDVWTGEGVTQDRDGSISAGLFGCSKAKDAPKPQLLLPPTATIKTPPLPTPATDKSAASPAPPPKVEAHPLAHGYQGEWDGYELSGLGNLYLPNGDHFFGLFQGGLRHGKGVLRKAAWEKADGGYAANINMGSINAAAVSCIPATAAGTWVDDKLQGNGTVKYVKGTLYQGDWSDGLREGNGQFRDTDGNIYHGDWRNDIQHGNGALFLVNKSEPIYLHPAPLPLAEETAASQGSLVGRMLGAIWGAAGGSAGASTPAEKPQLLGYEDLCSVSGTWVRESAHRNEVGKLCGTTTVFFTDLYEKVYETEYIGNKQRIQVPIRFLPPVPAPPTTGTSSQPIPAAGDQHLSHHSSSSPHFPNAVFTDLISPERYVAPAEEGGDEATSDPTRCTMCATAYSYFRKPISCTVCRRVACSSCLKDCQPPFLNKGKGVAAVKSPNLVVNGTVAACLDCQKAVKDGTVLATQWYTYRRHDVGTGSFTSSSPMADTPKRSGDNDDALVTTTTSSSSIRLGGNASPSLPCQYQVHKGYLTEGNIPNGPGVVWKGEEACYVGYLVAGHRSGLGCVRFSNGEEYIGSWKNSKMHGPGIYRSNDGVCYEGEFECGRMKTLRYQGEMRTVSTDPDHEYLGCLQRHGRGIACYEDGSRYNGEWEDGRRQGTGMLQLPDGSIFTGHFNKDAIHGTGKLVSIDSVFVGNYKGGERDGYGVLVTGLRTVQGTWVGGLLSGPVRVWDMDRNDVTDCLFFNGVERSDVFPIPMHQNDASVAACNACGSSFGMFLRRHHCRLCGKIYCDACSRGRSVMPLHFAKEDVPQRVCDNCCTLLGHGSTLAVKRYSDKGMYVGQWCMGRWAGRGIYRCPNGRVIIVKTPYIPHGATVPAGDARYKLSAQSTEPSSPADEGGSVEDRRQQLVDKPEATEEEVLGFTVWWGSLVRHAREDGFLFELSERNVTDTDIMHPPTSLLPFEIKVFTPTSHAQSQTSARDQRAISRRRAQFRKAVLPPMPRPPLHRRPTRPRKIVEPTDESVYEEIRQSRIDAFTVSSPKAETQQTREFDLCANNRATDVILSSVSRTPLNQVAPPKPELIEHEPDEGVEKEDSAGRQRKASLVDDAAPLVAWHNWDPHTAPRYKGTAFSMSGAPSSLQSTVIGAVGGVVGGGHDGPNPGSSLFAAAGETMGFSGGINLVSVVGMDSGPLEFDDVPQHFEVNWQSLQTGYPPVSQVPKSAVGGGVCSHFGFVDLPKVEECHHSNVDPSDSTTTMDGDHDVPTMSHHDRTESIGEPIIVESLQAALNPREVFKDEKPPPRHVDPSPIETAQDPVVAEDHPNVIENTEDEEDAEEVEATNEHTTMTTEHDEPITPNHYDGGSAPPRPVEQPVGDGDEAKASHSSVASHSDQQDEEALPKGKSENIMPFHDVLEESPGADCNDKVYEAPHVEHKEDDAPGKVDDTPIVEEVDTKEVDEPEDSPDGAPAVPLSNEVDSNIGTPVRERISEDSVVPIEPSPTNANEPTYEESVEDDVE